MTTDIKPVDLSDDELIDLEKALMIYLDAENSVAYEFTNNDYNCARSQGELTNDPYALEQALSLRDDVDRIVKNHENVKAMVKRLIAQAKVANELHSNFCAKGDT